MMRTAERKYFSNERFERFERILDIAKKMLAEVGPDRMTMRDLAAASKVSSATLYNRFGSKDNVISVAMIDHFERTISVTLERENGSSEPPIQRIMHMLRLLEQNTCDHHAFVKALMAIHFKVDGDSELRTQLYQQCYKLLLAILSENTISAAINPPVTPELLAEEASDKIFSIVIKWSQGDIRDDQLLNRLVFGVLSVLAAGIRHPVSDEIAQHLSKAAKQLKKSRKPSAVKGAHPQA